MSTNTESEVLRATATSARLRRRAVIAATTFALSVVGLSVVGTSSPAAAQDGDHIKCYPEYQSCGFYCSAWC
jgi:hypothetical protein